MCSREAISMNATLSKKLRFSDVVYAIGSTPKAVRLWLQRGLVEIHTPKPEGGGWTEYSFRDIAILALVRALVNFGVDVPTASSIANTIMGDHFFPQMNHLKNPDEMPAGALALMWSNRRLYLYRDGDDWRMKLVALWESDMGRRKSIAQLDPDRAVHSSDADFDPELPSGVATLRREHEPAPVYISIDVESVIRTAFERANESVNDGVDGDDAE
jgi:hypothetical protein